jgi:hypothetical protein
LDFETSERNYVYAISDITISDKYFIDMFEGLSVGILMNENAEWSDIGFDSELTFQTNSVRADPMEAALRIHRILPDSKILMIIRNQIDWLRSDYLHHISLLPKGKKRFLDYLETLEGKSTLYSALFDRIIDCYFKLFGRQNVHVMILEQLIENPTTLLKNLCHFLKIEFVEFPLEKAERNRGKGNLAGNLTVFLSKIGIADSGIAIIQRALNPLIALIPSALQISDVLTKRDRHYLKSFYAASNLHSSNLLELDLSQYGYPL